MRSTFTIGALTLTLVACSGGFGESTIDGELGNGAGSGGGGAIDVGKLGAGQAGTAGSAPLGGDACVTDAVEAVALPPVLQMVIDTSGSMEWPPGWDAESNQDPPEDARSKWEITESALRETVGDLPRDTALGVTFFPNISHAGTSCIKNQIALPIALLGDRRSRQRDLFDDALDGADPRGGTPTHAAYRFGMQTLTESRVAGNRFLLLITDGVPTYTLSCAGDGRTPVDSAPLVSDAAAMKKQGVPTFVIGSPGSEEARGALSALARAGGTASAECSDRGPNYCHFDMTRERDLGAALRAALASIAKRITSCEYPVPAAPAGKTLDPNRVNVVFSSDYSEAETIPRDTGTTCRDGWQYSADGRRVVLCGESCRRAQAEPDGQVELLFGCATQVSPR